MCCKIYNIIVKVGAPAECVSSAGQLKEEFLYREKSTRLVRLNKRIYPFIRWSVSRSVAVTIFSFKTLNSPSVCWCPLLYSSCLLRLLQILRNSASGVGKFGSSLNPRLRPRSKLSKCWGGKKKTLGENYILHSLYAMYKSFKPLKE